MNELTNEKEVWIKIDNCPSYRVSNLGRVKSLKFGKKKVLKPRLNCGYLKVALYEGGEIKNFCVHRLVGIAFIKNYENKPMINHISGVKTDNSVENLEWATAKENVQHSYNTGLKKAPKEEKHWKSKLSKKEVLEIRELYLTGKYVQREIAKMFSVGRQTISDILNRKNWKHI